MSPVAELVPNKDLKEEAIQRIKDAVQRISKEVEVGPSQARADGTLPIRTSEVKKMIGAQDKMDTPNDKNQNTPNISMHPIFSLKQPGAPRFVVLGTAAAVVLALIVLVSLFLRETTLRKHALSALAQAEQARAKLEASFNQLKAEMTKQKEELVKLADDLQSADNRAKQLRIENEAELTKVKGLYENQISDLKKTLRDKDNMIMSLEANLKSVRSLLEGKGEAISSMSLGGPLAVGAGTAPSEPVAKTYKPVLGKVLMVDQNNRFIVVNLGPADGAQLGQFIRVYQDKIPLGEARIDRIYQNLSAATVLSEDMIQRVRKGDSVYLTLS